MGQYGGGGVVYGWPLMPTCFESNNSVFKLLYRNLTRACICKLIMTSQNIPIHDVTHHFIFLSKDTGEKLGANTTILGAHFSNL